MDPAENLEAGIVEGGIMFLGVLILPGALPSASSQTTSFLLEPVEIGQQSVVDEGCLHAGSFPVEGLREATWNEIMAGILDDYAEAWERLAQY